MLNEFVVKYDKAVYNRRYAEEDEDFKTMNSRAVLSSDHPIKKKKIIDLHEYCILPRLIIHARYKVEDVSDRMHKIGGHSTEKGISLLTLWSVRAKFSKAIDNGRNFPLEISEIDAWLSSFLKKQAARNNVEKLVGDKMDHCKKGVRLHNE
ncbi:hypothetical protein RJ640_000313 [Escallonia rubra]|uniref:Uncharacterized protein n=1 Tax=Escallonia rubra TaxID=112253 RepID=A0AA88RSA2_9ASTE|nr:hypothetical protein RJ640_000313 [Escallonia rubra]